jgi:DNA-directed RNA polymerase subunit RPC12/RpoP
MTAPPPNSSALFDNAMSSIRMGIEDYAQDKPERSLSAVRNFYAGLLLLAKEVLVRHVPNADPDEVIGAKYKPVPDGAGGVEHIQDGAQTIDFATVAKRFKDFGLPMDKAAKSALDDLSTVRNDIEHRYTNKPAEVVRELIARAFPLTVQLFRLAGEDPRTLLSDVWAIMLEARDLYEAELARCRATLDAVGWLSATVAEARLRCTQCGSDLVEQRDPSNGDQVTMDLFCQGCGADLDVEAEIIEAVDRALSGEAYYRFKDAGESGPVFDCPDCSHATYIDTENACANCGYEFEWEAECVRCYASISLEDALAGFDNGLCPYCTHIMEKDD